MSNIKVAVSAVALTFGVNAYAEPITDDALWGVQQVAAICSASEIGEMKDDYWTVVKDIDELIGGDYEPNEFTRSQSMRHVMRAAMDPGVCIQSYGRVMYAVNEYKESAQ